jgi:hypothetical protein
LENTALPLRQKMKVDILLGALEEISAVEFAPSTRAVNSLAAERAAPKKPMRGVAAAMFSVLVLLTEKFVELPDKSLAIWHVPEVAAVFVPIWMPEVPDCACVRYALKCLLF